MEISKNDFISLIKDVADNLDDKGNKTRVNNVDYDLKDAENNLLEIITKKLSKNEAHKLFDSLIKPDVDTLKNTSGREKDKRNNILMILDNLKQSLFEGVCFHHKDKSPETEESIAERTKLKRQRVPEIVNENHTISLELFRKYFGYSNPSNMCKLLNDTKNTERNKAQVDLIKSNLTNLKRNIKNASKDDQDKMEKMNKVPYIVELIL